MSYKPSTEWKYSPSDIKITNCDDLALTEATYSKIGNFVTVFGKADILPFNNNQQVRFALSLPVPSNFVSKEYLAGTFHTSGNTTEGHGGSISGYNDSGDLWAEFDYYETHGSSDTIYYHFHYYIYE